MGKRAEIEINKVVIYILLAVVIILVIAMVMKILKSGGYG